MTSDTPCRMWQGVSALVRVIAYFTFKRATPWVVASCVVEPLLDLKKGDYLFLKAPTLYEYKTFTLYEKRNETIPIVYKNGPEMYTVEKVLFRVLYRVKLFCRAFVQGESFMQEKWGEGKRILYVIYALVILVATTLGAVAGLGGGVIIKPLLDLVGAHDAATINLYSCVAVFAMCCVSLTKQLREDFEFDKKTVLCVSAGSLLGDVLGNKVFSTLTGSFDNRLVKAV